MNLLSSNNLSIAVHEWIYRDVQKWINDTCVEHDLPKPYPTALFAMNGKGLLLLKKQDFIARSPKCGDVLYESLQRFIKKCKNNYLLHISFIFFLLKILF